MAVLQRSLRVATREGCLILRSPQALLIASLLLLTLGGCHLQQWAHNGFKVGPNYSRPLAPVASEWIDAKDVQIRSEKADLSEWWKIFDDPALDSLIETAYRQNLTLREAGARIQTAYAIRGITVGNLLPQFQELRGSHEQRKVSNRSALAAGPIQEQWFENNSLSLAASWELDFWGRFRRSVEAASAELDASVENYNDALVILLAEVATNYVQLRTFQKRLEVATRNALIQRVAYYVTSAQARVGTRDKVDSFQAKTILEQTRATIPAFEVGIRVANNRLCVLLGIPVHQLKELGVGDYERQLRDVYDQFDKELTESENNPNNKKYVVPDQLQRVGNRAPSSPRPIPQVAKGTPIGVGIPADLLRRRPDVQRAERRLAAQSARIGIAESDFYPRISLRGNIGVEAEQFEDLLNTPGSLAGAFGPSFNWAILNYGRIANGVRVQDALFQGLAFAYQNQVLQAGQEVEDGIISYLRFQDVADRREQSADYADQSVNVSFQQYKRGAKEVSFLSTVVFLPTLTVEQDRLAEARGNVALSLIQLYRALGGGWEMRLKREHHLHPGAPCTDPRAHPLLGGEQQQESKQSYSLLQPTEEAPQVPLNQANLKNPPSPTTEAKPWELTIPLREVPQFHW